MREKKEQEINDVIRGEERNGAKDEWEEVDKKNNMRGKRR